MLSRLPESINHPPLLPITPNPHRPQKPNNFSFKASNPTESTKNSKSHLSILDLPINSGTYLSILKSFRSLNFGKQIHAHSLKTGFGRHVFVETKLIQMYGKFGCLEDADQVFDKMPRRDLHAWTTLLSLYVDNELFEEAFLLFQRLQLENVSNSMDEFVFHLVLKVSCALGMGELGRQLHGIVLKYQFASNVYVGSALIDMYGKCGDLDDAKKVFRKMPEKDRVTWNSVLTACAAKGMVFEALDYLETMCLEEHSKPDIVTWTAVLRGFTQNCYDEEAVELLYRMQSEGMEPNAWTIASVLPSCARLQKLNLGKEIHGYSTRRGYMSNSYVVSGLLDMYRRCADIESGVKLFSEFSEKNAISCNTVIVGYCESGYTSEAKELFDQIEALGIRKEIISWNSMISGYVGNFQYDEAFTMFKDLLMEDGMEPDCFTLGSVLAACADIASFRLGKEVHSQAIVRGVHSNTFAGGALVEMYCKCQDLNAALKALDQVNERDVHMYNTLIAGYARSNQVKKIQNLLQRMEQDGFLPNVYTWSAILSGHVENNFPEVAMQLFLEMQGSNIRPDVYSVGIILSACLRLASIERGKQVHAYSIRHGYDSYVHIGATLVDMYAKRGSVRHAILAYERISNPNLICHNAMLTAYAMHGHGENGIALFQEMLKNGFRPDQVTFLAVLSSCVHVRSVEKGREFFDLMQSYDVKPTIKHYKHMIDLLSQTGLVSEAYDLIKEVTMACDSVLWEALLGGCLTHHNTEIGEIAAKRLIELEPNLYAYDGKWDDLARTRRKMKYD